jgi:magnesium chelatase family protein
MTYPARIMLIAAMNPTPDGKMVGQSKSTPQEIRRYLAKISGPLLDRIDLHVEAAAVSVNDLTGEFTAESSASIRARVEAARDRQRERFAASPRTRCNAQMTAREMKSHCAIDSGCLELLKAVIHDRNLSARAYDRILKVSRTIADLAGSSAIEEDHLMEAVQYRGLDRQLWGE